MTLSSSTGHEPRKVLLATDLSARGDRALERAIAIATAWKANLTILHVFEEIEESTLTYRGHPSPSWRAAPDAVEIAKARVRQGLRADLHDAVVQATVRIEAGEPADVIERVAESDGAELIVTGIAREGLFASRPVVLGRTVEQLLRRTPIPVLIVRNRARSSYEHILVTTDFSVPSAHALQMALRFFPSQALYLLHAVEPPYSNLASDPHQLAEACKMARAGDLETFLGSIFLPEEERRRIVPLIEVGPPGQLVREYVRDRLADLVVLGTHGRGAVMETLLGSTAKRILSALPCDALVVRGPRSSAPREN